MPDQIVQRARLDIPAGEGGALNAVLLEQLIESYRLVAANDPKPEARAKAQSRVMELEMRRSMLSPPETE